MLGNLKGSLKIFLEHSLASCSYWRSDILHAVVECGSAFIEDISKAGIQTHMVGILMQVLF